MFIDVHCHLDRIEDVSGAVERAKKEKVKFISNGTDVKTNRQVLEFSGKYGIMCALGIYPLDALKMSDSKIDEEIEFIRDNKNGIVAIGEVGMDFKERIEPERQEKIFRKFVKLSVEIGKPIIVHSRKAEIECIRVLEEEKATKVVMHCFSGKKGLVKKIQDNKWNFSIPASVKNSEHFQNIARETDLKQLLCETDSPFLHPDKERNNEPKFVIESYKKIAEVKGLSLKEVEKKIGENFKKIFDIKA
jgi:TatD DNase family protein